MAAAETKSQFKRQNSTKSCCVPLCKSVKYRKEKQLSFHRFPREESQRKLWIVKIRRELGPDFAITSNTRVCSEHFCSEDFEEGQDLDGRRRLKKYACPSIFAWTVGKRPRRTLVRIIPNDKNEGQENIKDPLIQEIEQLKSEVNDLKAQLSALKIYKFGSERFLNDDGSIKFYTGFPSYKHFITFYQLVQPSAETMTYCYASGMCAPRPGAKKMVLLDELFMLLVRIHLGLKQLDLSHRFNVSESTVSRKNITWANYLYFFLGMQPIWPSFESVKTHLPHVFKSLSFQPHVILDCTEIKVQVPSSLKLQSQMYSQYKSSTTLKGLVGITPHGAVSFVSSLYTGSISDREITIQSGILDLLEPGRAVMTDKGFYITDLLKDRQVELIVPPYLSENAQFSPKEVVDTKTIAHLRIHVERAIRRIKEFGIFHGDFPLSLLGSVNQFWTVACLLTNFQGPLILRNFLKG